MPADTFVTRLNEQIGNEFAAHQQYVAIAVRYDAETLPQLARFFYRQAMEERDHAMMIVQYLVDSDADVTIPGVTAPQTAFEDIATMSDLLRVVERSKDDPMEIENFMAREHASGEESDPTAPHAAGA